MLMSMMNVRKVAVAVGEEGSREIVHFQNAVSMGGLTVRIVLLT